MLTSLNVVSIAAVDCDSTSRSAMRARSLDIGTLCSGRSPAEVAVAAVEAEGAAGEGPRAEGEGVFSTWAATSSLVMRPPRPLPLIELISSAVSFACAARFRAAGIIAGAAAAGEEGAEVDPASG